MEAFCPSVIKQEWVGGTKAIRKLLSPLLGWTGHELGQTHTRKTALPGGGRGGRGLCKSRNFFGRKLTSEPFFEKSVKKTNFHQRRQFLAKMSLQLLLHRRHFFLVNCQSSTQTTSPSKKKSFPFFLVTPGITTSLDHLVKKLLNLKKQDFSWTAHFRHFGVFLAHFPIWHLEGQQWK